MLFRSRFPRLAWRRSPRVPLLLTRSMQSNWIIVMVAIIALKLKYICIKNLHWFERQITQNLIQCLHHQNHKGLHHHHHHNGLHHYRLKIHSLLRHTKIGLTSQTAPMWSVRSTCSMTTSIQHRDLIRSMEPQRENMPRQGWQTKYIPNRPHGAKYGREVRESMSTALKPSDTGSH